MSDLISRADALEQMAQAECGLHYDDCEADNCSCSYIKRILDIPSADSVQAHGKWQRFNDEHGTYWTGCSNCKGDIPKDKYGIDMYTNFCPNCGADMRETK